LVARGADKRLVSTLHVAPVGCEALTKLLFERPDRPGVVLVLDDGLVAPLLAGLAGAKVRPGRDVHVVAHGHWPLHAAATKGGDELEQVGFDVRELLGAARESLDAQRAGETCADAVIKARLASELGPVARAA